MGSIGTSMVQENKPWRETPLVESYALSKAAGCRIFLKLENLQPSGSFKSRGIGNLMLSHLSKAADASKIHFYSSSGGNAGLACVHAARTLQHPATVVVPLSTKPLMIARLKAAGAHDVIQHGASWKEADAYLREVVMIKDEGGVYIPPFDHPEIWNGNATLVSEIGYQLNGEKPDALICSVGGGGLFSGLMQGLDEMGWPDMPVLAMETKGAESLHASLKAGELVTLPGISSLATSLGATRVAEKAFEYGKRNNVKSVVLEDKEAAMGCWRLADDERLMVEMACGVNAALCYEGRLQKVLGQALNKESKVVIILCGGSNVTVEMLSTWREEFGAVESELPQNSMVPSAQSAPNGVAA
ncbi:catabolic L-serine/threonine dehydratase [Coniosporium apollinis]|uniref:L-serine ammonia-lyase n=1 Tax=Coniosporium apollinis TaxID=61459 RepID=A0ABQ9P5P7_9PEZI|nr:catabolic L-serine/threonine dehydratase [Coniosporium apollinis]